MINKAIAEGRGLEFVAELNGGAVKVLKHWGNEVVDYIKDPALYSFSLLPY